MTQDQLEDILYKLKEMEWRLHRVDNGPDEYHCPGHCCIPLFKNQYPEFFVHTKDCDYKSIMDMIEKEMIIIRNK